MAAIERLKALAETKFGNPRMKTAAGYVVVVEYRDATVFDVVRATD